MNEDDLIIFIEINLIYQAINYKVNLYSLESYSYKAWNDNIEETR